MRDDAAIVKFGGYEVHSGWLWCFAVLSPFHKSRVVYVFFERPAVLDSHNAVLSAF